MVALEMSNVHFLIFPIKNDKKTKNRLLSLTVSWYLILSGYFKEFFHMLKCTSNMLETDVEIK